MIARLLIDGAGERGSTPMSADGSAPSDTGPHDRKETDHGERCDAGGEQLGTTATVAATNPGLA